MDMKYDSSVMHSLTDATEQRMVEAYNYLEKVVSASESINTSDWDDEERREFESAIAEIKTSLMTSIQGLNEYLDYLRAKMSEFENRG